MQDYKMVVRSVYGGQSNEVAQSLDEAQEYINAVYLAAGYKVLSVDFLGEIAVNELEQSNSPRALRFAWHLVKEINVKANDK